MNARITRLSIAALLFGLLDCLCFTRVLLDCAFGDSLQIHHRRRPLLDVQLITVAGEIFENWGYHTWELVGWKWEWEGLLGFSTATAGIVIPLSVVGGNGVAGRSVGVARRMRRGCPAVVAAREFGFQSVPGSHSHLVVLASLHSY